MQKRKMTFRELAIDHTWTLFLDRDGVINAHIEGVYVTSLLDFKLLPGAAEAIAGLSQRFGRIIVVTNQQAVGKGLLSEEELGWMHDHVQSEVNKHGGKVDLFLYAAELQSEGGNRRKPGTGMAMEAQQRFPEIDFSRSVIVGDSPSDMLFGQRLCMKTVFIQNPWKTFEGADFTFSSLSDFYYQLSEV